MTRSSAGSTVGCRSNAVIVPTATNHHLTAYAAPTDVSALCTMGYRQLNPIPLNPTPGSPWTASDPEVEREFVATLTGRGIPTTVRDTRGRDIDGACGQLAAQG